MIRAEFSDYIVFIIFILFSIISSIFNNRKKAQEKRNAGTPKPVPPQRPQQMQQRKQEPENLSDIFEMLLSGKKQSEVQTERSTFETREARFEQMEKPDEQGRRREEAAQLQLERERERTSKMQRDTRSTIEKIAEAGKGIPKLTSLQGKEKVNEKAAAIKSRLFDVKSLKDYIIISEIIGKPKAMRR